MYKSKFFSYIKHMNIFFVNEGVVIRSFLLVLIACLLELSKNVAIPVSDSPKMHYFWSIQDIFEGSQKHSNIASLDNNTPVS